MRDFCHLGKEIFRRWIRFIPLTEKKNPKPDKIFEAMNLRALVTRQRKIVVPEDGK